MGKIKLLNGIRVILSDFWSIMKREISFYQVRPSISTLFLTYRCDSKCKTCTRWQAPQEELEPHEIGFEQWKNIIDQLVANNVMITEVFGGNVLLRKDLLLNVLEYMHCKGIIIHLPTNQIGLDDDVAEAIIKYVDHVYISTDGLTEQQNEIRGIEDASQNVEMAIDRLLRVRKTLADCTKKTRIVCNNTVSRFNYEIMEEMVEYALVAGFDEIHFEYAGEFLKGEIDNSVIDDSTPEPHYIRREQSILVDPAMATNIKRTIRKMKKKYRGKGLGIETINIDTRSEKSLSSGLIPHGKCYVLRREVTVDPSGNLIACPFITNYIIGNLLTDSFTSLWNNERHRKLRQVHSSGGLPMCTRCILGIERNPGIIQSLKRIYFSRVEPVLFSR